MNKITPELIERLSKKRLLGDTALKTLQYRLKQQLEEEKEQQLKELHELNQLSRAFNIQGS
jgi:hypothetical protein